MEPSAPPFEPDCPPAYDFSSAPPNNANPDSHFVQPGYDHPGTSNPPLQPPRYQSYNSYNNYAQGYEQPTELNPGFYQPPPPPSQSMQPRSQPQQQEIQPPVAAPRNVVNVNAVVVAPVIVRPGQGPQQRRQSITSVNTVTDGDQAHEALKFDAWTKCSAGVLGQANRLSATFNQLRQANKLIGPSCARVFFFGGSGCCGSFVSLIFEVITVCELIIRFFVHSTDVINCPWIIKAQTRNYMLMGKMAVFRETDPDEMARNARNPSLPRIRMEFSRNSPAWGMYYSPRYYRKNVSNVSVFLLLYMLAILASAICFTYFGVKWGQLIVP
ncbi:uncharacterized protein LOC142348054 [Convolutriloba macropyga]|uniref:uncharacterized protein LOC142348054 n=1 Tax=Convolutriloba macropyga TaxID=536237 RepID=UPI003F51BE85